MRTIVGIAGRWIGYLFLSLVALAAIGTLFPTLGGVATVGRGIVFAFGPWLVVVAVIGAVLGLRRWRRSRERAALASVAIATVAALATVYVEAAVVRTAAANGVRVDLARSLWLGPTTHRGAPAQRLTYTHDAGRALPLAIYRPAASAAPAPVLVYVHGGGWISGTLDQRNPDLRWFADHGYVVVTVEYALSSPARHTWNVVQPQIGCALAWVGANAARFGGDPSRIAMLGDSAGGNLVLNAAYMAASGTLPSSCSGQVPRVSATIALYPVVDPARFYHNDDPVLGATAQRMASAYAGGAPEALPDRYAAITTATHLAAGAPPTLVIVGEADKLVQPDPAYALVARARGVGVDIRLVRVPYADHAFDYMSGSPANQLVRGASLRFLQAHRLAPAGRSE